jgi:hypothetical protein
LVRVELAMSLSIDDWTSSVSIVDQYRIVSTVPLSSDSYLYSPKIGSGRVVVSYLVETTVV